MAAKIQMTDLKAQYDSIKLEIDAGIQEVINDTSFILGKQVALFEEEICRYFGVKYTVGVASGTDALVLALCSLGIGAGDEVITTPFTFIATAEAISRVGAKPVFCDIDYSTLNISAEQIRKKVTSKTKAILPVHLYGLPCAMDKIMTIAKEFNLKVVEDCAQSFGSEFKGKKVGAFGNCGCLSFFPAKTLGCFGDGGMIITDSEEVAQKAKMLRNHGSTKKYYYGMHGFNSRLDTLQAAILRVKLKHVDQWIEKRIANAYLYNQGLSGVKGIELQLALKGLSPQGTVPEYRHTYNYYTIRVKNNRSGLQERLKEAGIPTMVYYPVCLHLQDVYCELGYKKGDFPIAEAAQEEVLSLPMYAELNKEQIEEIVKTLIAKQGLSPQETVPNK